MDDKPLDLVNKCIGVRGKIIDIEFNEDGRRIKCLIPDDQLWIAIKDVLLLEGFKLPIFYYGYSMSKLFHNYRRIKGSHRLKWFVFVFVRYTGFNILRALKFMSGNKFNSLCFLYAWRE
jgi:hypothetical protein